MIELRKYSKAELATILGTKDNQAIKRKLNSWGVRYDEPQGRGDAMTINITGLTDPFKVFALTELGVSAQTDFCKLRDFLYYFLNDEEFSAMPDEVKEHRMRAEGRDISRQTIANYEEKLKALGYFATSSTNCIYYFAYKNTQRIVERGEYLDAWHQYWADRETGASSFGAIQKMRQTYGGVARKQSIPEFNGIYTTQIKVLNTYIQESFEREMEAVKEN